MNDMIIKNLQIEDIHDDESFNCRGKILPIDVIDLAKDIKENGLHQPVVVCPYSEEKVAETGKKYRLVAGFRRLMAHRVNSDKIIAAIIKPRLTEIDALKINLAENLQRQSLNIYQEALAIKRMKEFGLTEFEAATALGMSRGWVQVRFMLLNLPPEIQKEAAAGFLNQTQIRELYQFYSKTGNLQRLCEIVKDLKTGKMRAEEVRLQKPKNLIMQEKRQRKRPEIFSMMEHIQECGIGNGIWTRTMAWCAGQISTDELEKSLKEYADENGLEYLAMFSEVVQ